MDDVRTNFAQKLAVPVDSEWVQVSQEKVVEPMTEIEVLVRAPVEPSDESSALDEPRHSGRVAACQKGREPIRVGARGLEKLIGYFLRTASNDLRVEKAEEQHAARCLSARWHRIRGGGRFHGTGRPSAS